MSESDQPGFLQQAGNFAADATVDTAADGFINNVVDGVASHLPGGSAVDAVLKTGIDFAANTAINKELGSIEGMFGHHEEAAASDAQS
jgi:hypothetical protein